MVRGGYGDGRAVGEDFADGDDLVVSVSIMFCICCDPFDVAADVVVIVLQIR